jgi:hypothetical protein
MHDFEAIQPKDMFSYETDLWYNNLFSLCLWSWIEYEKRVLLKLVFLTNSGK